MGAGFSKRFLLLVLIPAVVLASATGLRLWVTKVLLSYDRIRFDVELPFDPADELPSAFVAAAYGYGVSLMLLAVIAVFAAAFALWLMMQAELPGGRLALGLSLLASALALVINMAIWGEFDLIETEKLFAPSVDLLPSNLAEVSVGAIIRIVVSINRAIWFPTVILLVFAAASCLSVPINGEPLVARDLARRMAWLRAILYLGAGLLVAALIATRALIDLPGSLFPPSDIPSAIADFGLALQLYLGSTMTFLLAAIYVPPLIGIGTGDQYGNLGRIRPH